ncbi:MAG: hypothetical protein K2F95_01985 [Alistipes sp.]|nr:hypothetical protein [Alistipes sp.]MDE7129215.1 hypothetical protein [Alistipes sp.]
MRKRMFVGFLSIILLLFFSGMVSLFELGRVSNDTEEILLASKSNVELAGEMISALNEQNDAMICMSVIGDSSESYRDACKRSIERLANAVRLADGRVDDNSAVDSLVMRSNILNAMVTDYLDGNLMLTDEYSSQDWYVDSYKDEYLNVASHITSYMTGAQSTLGPEVNRLSRTAYRAVTPVFISLVVMLVVVLMFYYFLSVYYIRPILRMNKSLGDYLTFKVPFDVGITLRDELVELKERIMALVSRMQ